jgi:NAD-dependent DNA ligase
MGKVCCPADLYALERRESELCTSEKDGNVEVPGRSKGAVTERYAPYSRRERVGVEETPVEADSVDSDSRLVVDVGGSDCANEDEGKPPQARLLEEYTYSGPLEQVIGYQERSLDNLYRAIEDSRRIPLHRFLFSLGMRFVGLNTCKLLAREFGSFDEFWGLVSNPSRCKLPVLLCCFYLSSPAILLYVVCFSNVFGCIADDELVARIGALSGVGLRVVESLADLARTDSATRETVEQLLPYMQILDDAGYQQGAKKVAAYSPETEQSDTSGATTVSKSGFPLPLAGKIVVFTGGMSHALCSREENISHVEALGGRVGTAVTRRTHILVIGDLTNGKNTSKLRAVQEKYGDSVETWSSDRWIRFLQEQKRV